ncbi:hypothetical protein JCM6882_008042 [Rhodosporidiobolus microsporus]
MDGTSITATAAPGAGTSALAAAGPSKRWSAGLDLLTSGGSGTNAPPIVRPLARSSSASRIYISPASSTVTSRAPSPVHTPSPAAADLTPPPPPPVPIRRYTPSPKPRTSSPSPSLSRRLSKPLLDAAYLAATPSTYVTFVRSLHPSLLAFFLVSVSAVISNKALLRGFFHGLTYALTAWQMACATLGTVVGERIGAYRATRVAKRHDRVLVLCALVFSLEILASNLALRLVPVPFHVSLRACSPILTLLLSCAFFRSSTTLRTSASLLLIVLGASLTSHHEAWASPGSLLLLASAALLSAKSLLVTHLLQAHLALSPLDILARIAPLSMIHCGLFAVANGEVVRFWRFLRSGECTKVHLAEVALNGALSFALVPLGLTAERNTRPPALAVATHAAQATTILASLLVFGLRLSPLNFIGVALSLAGGVLYARWDAADGEEREGGVAGAAGGGGGKGGEALLPVRREKRAPD